MPLEQKSLEEYVVVDLEGGKQEEFEKFVIPDDSYEFEVTNIELVDSKNYQTGAPEKKLLFKFQTQYDNKPIQLSFFCNPKIMKAREGSRYFNSKLYDVMVSIGLMEEFKENKDWHSGRLTFEALKEFLEKNLLGAKVKAITRTVNSGQLTAYSVVDRIVRKL